MKFLDKVEEFLEGGEDYPNEPVPQEERRPWWSIGMVWVGLYICIVSILEGLALIAGLPLHMAILAEVVGFLIFLTLMFLQGNIGTETGLSTYMLVRESFGSRGSHIISIISFIGSFGWYALQSRTMAESLATMFGFTNVPLISVVAGVLMMLTAIIGFRAIAFISQPTIIYTFVVMVFIAVKSLKASPHSIGELAKLAPLGDPITFSAAISIVVGGMAIGALQAPDVMRFSRSREDNLKALYFMVLPVAIVQPIASMFAGLAMGSTELGYVLTTAGGVLGLILIVLGTWTSNDNGLYSASLAITEIFPNFKRWKVTMITGIAASFLAAIIDLNMYANLMFFFSSIAVPVLGVTIADYYILPKMGMKSGLAKQQGLRLNSAAIISWAIGAALEAGLDFGIIPNPYEIPAALVCVLITAVLYVFIMKNKYSDVKITDDNTAN